MWTVIADRSLQFVWGSGRTKDTNLWAFESSGSNYKLHADVVWQSSGGVCSVIIHWAGRDPLELQVSFLV